MPKKPTTPEELLAENEDLRARLDEAEETLRAIRGGEVDALVVSGVDGEEVFTRKSADRAYRVLIEEMNEGALTLTADGVILYANRRFAEMLKMPLEKMVGSTIHTWIAADSQPILQSLLRQGGDERRREELVLSVSDGTLAPVSLSACNLSINEGPGCFGLVAADLTEQKRADAIAASEKLARELLAASNQSRLELQGAIEDQRRTEEELRKHREHLEERVRDRTAELRELVDMMAGRENRMADLKEAIKKLRAQLEAAGMTPVADDPLLEGQRLERERV